MFIHPGLVCNRVMILKFTPWQIKTLIEIIIHDGSNIDVSEMDGNQRFIK